MTTKTRIYAISGSHSTGKSTILKSLEDRGFHVSRFQTSRNILQTLGMSLEEITNDEAKLIAYQTMVLYAKKEHDYKLKEEYIYSEPVFVERSFADVLAYACQWQRPDFKVYGDFLESFYARKCQEFQSIYDKTFFLPPKAFAFVDDGIRAKEETQLEVSTKIYELLNSTPSYDKRFEVIHSKEVDHRIEEIIALTKK